MCSYALITMLAEALNLYVQTGPRDHLPMTIARVLMYLGTFSFIVFIRTCIVLRRYETKGVPNQQPTTRL
jgi:hypothetical protein